MKLAAAERKSKTVVEIIRERIARLSISTTKGLNQADAVRLSIAAEVVRELEEDLTDHVFGFLGRGLKLPTGPERTPSKPPEVTANVDAIIREIVDQLPYEPAIRARVKNLLASIGIRTYHDLQLFSEPELAHLPFIGKHSSSVAQTLQKRDLTLTTEKDAGHPPLEAPVAKLHTLGIAKFDLRDRTRILALNQNIGFTLHDVAKAVEGGHLIPGHLFTKKQITKIEEFIRRIQLPRVETK